MAVVVIRLINVINTTCKSIQTQPIQGHGDVKRKEDERRTQQKPNSTLFITNFDLRTRERDLERLYEKYGRLTRVQIKKTFAFVQVGVCCVCN